MEKLNLYNFFMVIVFFIDAYTVNGAINPGADTGADFVPHDRNAPFHLSLQTQEFKHFCSAALVAYPNERIWNPPGIPAGTTFKHRQFGLTSANCVRHRIWPILAVAGQTDNTNRSHVQIRVITNVSSHPDFNPQTMRHNIAILFFEWNFKPVITPAPGKPAIWPINYDLGLEIEFYPPNGDPPFLHVFYDPLRMNRAPLYITGYGIMSPEFTQADRNKLQVYKTMVFNDSFCEIKYKYTNKKGVEEILYKPTTTFTRCYNNFKRLDTTKKCYGDDGAPVVRCNVYTGACQSAGPTTLRENTLAGIYNHGQECFHKVDVGFFTAIYCYSMSYNDTVPGTNSNAGWFDTVLNEGKPTGALELPIHKLCTYA